MGESLGEAFPKELERIRTVLGYYKEAGFAGAFGAAMIERTIRKAETALSEGDTVAMMRAFRDMQEVKG